MNLRSPQSDLHPILIEHLAKQGICSDKELTAFLFPKLKDLPSPFLMKDMDKAVHLVQEAIAGKYHVLVWGDYDVDGVSGTALLILFFRHLGVNVGYHIPNRTTEGYGLNDNSLRTFSSRSEHRQLLITVDCGISNNEEIKRAKRLGYKVIVTDHHKVPDELLVADAVLNPRQEDCAFPYKDLAGVGVAFYLAAGIRSHLIKNNVLIKETCKINMKYFMGLVALGTIADMMPLTGVNRILARGGFETIDTGSCDGITYLLDALDIDPNQLNSESVAFLIGPTINASGRLGEPLTALHALIGDSPDKLIMNSKKLIGLNKKRKKLCNADSEKAIEQVTRVACKELKSVVLNDEFHDGLLGIIASRIVEQFSVPTLICCPDPVDPAKIKGSGRAPIGFDLFSALSACSRFLLRFGGHHSAAGFSLDKNNFELFKKSFDYAVHSALAETKDQDSEIHEQTHFLSVSEALNKKLLHDLKKLEPVGEGNKKPYFIDERMRFVSLNFFGLTNNHIRGVARGKYQNIPLIGFNLGERVRKINIKEYCTVKYCHMFDSYNGAGSWKIRLEDIWQ